MSTLSLRLYGGEQMEVIEHRGPCAKKHTAKSVRRSIITNCVKFENHSFRQ